MARGGGSGRRRSIPPWLIAAAALAVAASATAVLLERRGDGESSAYRFQGQAVRNAGELLVAADRAFLRAAHREDASLGADSRCFLSQRQPGGDVEPFLRCGPVVHYGGTADRPWDHVEVRSTPVKGGLQLERTGTIKPGQAMTTVEVLTRPDGARPAAATGLRPPDPPRLGLGEVVLASRVEPEGALRAVDASIVGPGTLDVRITELGTTPQVRISPGLRRPAAGEELVAFSLNVRSAAGAAFEVIVGPRRAPLPETAASGRHLVAVSVPTGAEPHLEVTVRGTTQALSLRTGQRVGAAIPLLAGRPRATLSRVLERQQVSFGVNRTPQNVALSSFTVVEAEVLAHSEWLGTAPSGTGWLAIEVQGLNVPTVADTIAVRLDVAASFVAVVPDGRLFAATELGQPSGGRTVYIAVPDSFRAGALRITPTFAVETNSGTGVPGIRDHGGPARPPSRDGIGRRLRPPLTVSRRWP